MHLEREIILKSAVGYIILTLGWDCDCVEPCILAMYFTLFKKLQLSEYLLKSQIITFKPSLRYNNLHFVTEEWTNQQGIYS